MASSPAAPKITAGSCPWRPTRLASDLDDLDAPAQRKQEPREMPELVIEAFLVGNFVWLAGAHLSLASNRGAMCGDGLGRSPQGFECLTQTHP